MLQCKLNLCTNDFPWIFKKNSGIFSKEVANYSSNLSRFFKMTYQNSMIWVVLDKVFCYLVIKALTPRQMLAQSTVWFLPTSQSQQSYMSYQHLLALIFFFNFNWDLIHVYQSWLYVLNYLYLQWPNPFFSPLMNYDPTQHPYTDYQ